jgi:acylphosphatase
MAQKCIHAVVHGRVQGVFFRDCTQQEAQKLALYGWVKNLPDGTVETVFQGDATDVDRMLAWLYVGSPASAVTKVESREQFADTESTFFEVRY